MKFKRDFENFTTACIPWEMKIKEIESNYANYINIVPASSSLIDSNYANEISFLQAPCFSSNSNFVKVF